MIKIIIFVKILKPAILLMNINYKDLTPVSPIYKSLRTLVSSAKTSDNTNILIKTTANPFPPIQDIEMIRHEYEIAKDLKHENIAQIFEILDNERTVLMFREYFEGISLSSFLQSKPELKTTQILHIAIQISEAIQYIHSKNIIHKDINPNNILINPSNLSIKLIDFGIATKQVRETIDLINLSQLEGTLDYISPEQTGRVNRSLDYKTDLYSLGVVLYQLFTKRLPFISDDSLELIHAHIALTPEPLHYINTAVPEVISEIVLKLLAKNAEDRYNSAAGLLHDLLLCKENLAITGLISNFKIAQVDFSTKLQIPQKLYGREAQRNELLTIYDTVNLECNAALIFIKGVSGVGKTSLINEIHKPMTQNNGFFIKGKFDQLQRNIPYLALLNAFDDFIDQVITESDAKLAIWKEKLLKALDINIKVVMNFLPRLEAIVGEQPEVEVLPSAESQNRLENTFTNFIRVIATSENPLCMFIDDLQWADASSLKLMEVLLQEPERKSLLMIGAYRDNEVDTAHPLLQTIQNIEKQGVRVTNIHLDNLQLQDITNLVNDTLQRKNINATAELAKLIFSKTQGNAFFVNQFLNSLYQSNQLNFDLVHQKWIWDIESIKELNQTANVADFIAQKINQLPSELIKILSYAAAISNTFDVETVAAITENTEEKAKQYLQIAIEEEILVKRKQNYQFMHDKVQQAAYSMVAKDEKVKMHLEIATLWSKNISTEQLENNIFNISNQYNFALSAIKDENQKAIVANYNLIAGKKALSGNAFSNASEYLLIGYKLLPENSWQTAYTQTIDFVTALVESEYQNGKFDKSESYANLIIENAKTPLEKAEMYNNLIIQNTLKQDFVKAIACGIIGLKLVGVEVPDEEDLPPAVGAGIGDVMVSLGGRVIADLVHQPDIESETDRMTVKLLVNLAPTAFLLGKQMLWTYVIVNATAISLKKGNMPESCTAYSSFGIISGAAFSDYVSGYEYGKLAIGIADKYGNLRVKTSALFVVGTFLRAWTDSIKGAFESLLDSIRNGVSSGELQFASYSAGNTLALLFHSSHIIKEALSYLNTSLAVAQKAQNFFAESSILVDGMLLHLLSEPKQDEIQVSHLKLSIGAIKRKYVIENNPLILFSYSYSWGLANFYLGKHEQGFRDLLASENYLFSQNGGVYQIDFFCFMPLMAIYTSWQSKDSELLQLAESKFSTYFPKLEMLNTIAPHIYSQRHTIILAIQAAMNNESSEAMRLFDEAIDLALQNGFLNDYALYYELAAIYYGSMNRNKIKEIYMLEAYYNYANWGAYAKVELLEIENRFILEKTSTQNTTNRGTSTKQTLSRSSATISNKNYTNDESTFSQIDISSIVKANLVLASEVVLDKLCQTLMAVVVESAGANRGILVIKKQGEMLVFAEKLAKTSTEIIPNTNLKEAIEKLLLPEEIINYAINSRKTLVIDNVQQDEKFAKSTYVKQNNSKSILCLPLIHQKDLIGILYFENSLISGAFTSKRLAMLNLLSSQITISVVNALLYENLEEKVKDRTAKLSEAYDLIQRKNFDITSSINYAKRIQDAMLPSVQEINSKINSFVFFLPKDIVSGDFYWFAEKDGNYILAVGDCTGHGVPGALMSMLGSEALNKAVHDLEIHAPDTILTELHRSISKVLKQQETGSRDGMDIAIITINKTENKAYFAGAMNPLYYIQNEQFIEIKADKMPIGGQSIYVERAYTTHTVDIAIPTTLYLCSDGFQDQFGGEQNRKYLTKNFKNFLYTLHSEHIEIQKDKLHTEFEKWKGKLAQIDDVLIVGIKL